MLIFKSSSVHQRVLISSVIICFLTFASCHNQEKESSAETILAVFAHPDDETTIAPVLAKLGMTENVYLVIATDGRFGITDHMGIPAGDTLVAIRKEEAACSCGSMGIHPPIFLDLQDGLGLNGHGDFYEQIPLLKERLLATIKRVRPSKMITFGPDGDTGHPDHRLVGNITTEVLLQEGLTDQIELYYFGWNQEQAERYSWWNLSYVHAKGLDTKISYSGKDKEKGIQAIRCYHSQYPQEEMDRWIKAEENHSANYLFFRKLIIDEKKKTAL